MGIQIFACDHRKNVDWKLPYIRIGGPESDCLINIKDDVEIAPYSVLLSEGAKIWWVWKHLADFGNPEYVGFCHYRRFFTIISKNPITDISANDFKSEYCMTPYIQKMILTQSNSDCLTFHPLHAISKLECNYKSIIDQLKFLSKKDKLGITDDICDRAFQYFIDATPNNIKDMMIKSLYYDEMFACNIFTMKSKLLDEYCKIFIPAIKQLYNSIPIEQYKTIHPRFLGYILERFTSCYIHTLKLRNMNVNILPLMTLDGGKHVKWESPTNV